MSRFLTAAKDAFKRGADAVSRPGSFDASGYCVEWRSNLAEGLPVTDIESDLRSGAGQELSSKFRAAHSSSALAVNMFGWWRRKPETFPLQKSQTISMKFEVACASGLAGHHRTSMFSRKARKSLQSNLSAPNGSPRRELASSTRISCLAKDGMSLLGPT